MAGIKDKDTGLEMLLRRGLHRAGFRYRLHAPNLPGRPDVVLPKYNAVIQANGCFWHGHDCDLFKLPSTNRERWRKKLEGNRQRDLTTQLQLEDAGWRVLVVWECAVKGQDQIGHSELLDRISSWVDSSLPSSQIRGERPSPAPGDTHP